MSDHVSVPPTVSPAQLKAMAHPLRLQLLDLLEVGGPATASGLGRLVGESSGTTSYHLRRLADAGMIEEDPAAGTRRDRVWRSVPGGWSLDRTLWESPATATDAQMVFDELVRTRIQRLRQWDAAQTLWPDPWRDVTRITTTRITMTPEEAAALGQAVHDLLQAHRARQPDHGTPGTARVVVHFDVLPVGDPPPEPAAETGSGGGSAAR